MSKKILPATEPTALPSPPVQEPGEDAVRDYAYHLYQQGNCAPGHDVDNWLEATACLKAQIPSHLSHSRLHQHINSAQKTDRLFSSPALAQREAGILHRGRESLESAPRVADADIRTSLFDDRP